MAIYIDDRELVAAHQAGDGEAFDELVREHRRSLLSHAKNKLHCDAASEDALQETLVRAYKALPRFNGEYRLGPWLHRIMSNVCIDEANRRKRDGEKTDQYAAQRTLPDEMPSVEDELGLHLDDSALKAALDGLSEPYRQALELKFVQEYDYSELAAVSGVSEENARARVSRARLAMRSALKGVAAIPVVLLGVLKRGEKAAAAATSSGGAIAASTGSTISGAAATVSGSAAVLPTITEAAVAATNVAPTAIPVLTKAVVGVGLAAAVFTPTSDSALHNAVEDFRSNELLSGLSTTMESTPISAPLEIEIPESSEGTAAPASVESSTEVTLSSGAPDRQLPEFERGTVADSATQTPLSGAEGLVTGSIKTPFMTISAVGSGRYILSGAIELQFDGRTVQGTLTEASTLSIALERDDFGESRLNALLVIMQPSGEIIETRLAGFAVTDGTDYKVAGLFSVPSQAGDVSQRGTFKGIMRLANQDSAASIELYLTG